VLIPGVVERWHFMEPLGKRLAHAGLAVHFTPGLGRNLLPVLESAPIVGEVVDRVAAAHPHARIVLVGHSKGGLIGKRLLVDRALHPLKPQPAGLVALATPFAGSSRARLLPGEYLREFDPSNEMLLALAAERSADARIRVVLPQLDPHVPKNRVPDGMRGVRLRASGHFRPLATAEAARAVIAAIHELTERRPAPSP
jgi:alpha-beta hydrolase superfamily lysophospholipase